MNQEGESIQSNETPCNQEGCAASQETAAQETAAQESVSQENAVPANAVQEEKGASTPGLYCKVSPKGGVSVYGLQRMPVTLYVEQWHRLLEFGDELLAFLSEHAAELKRKEK